MNKVQSTEELLIRLQQGEKINLVDVREDEEWEEGHIPEARHVALSRLQESMDELQADSGTIWLICRSGARSGRASDYLNAMGYDAVNVEGGMLAWAGEVAQGR
ncbi:rhodanese-like domain-containing protein [Paenibacillus herberti]|uniref:Sulfurtransferase n=1 Tax=Paenibacillus herberti TaxID=1619309 RepID=A0A229P210_9BACL|nr:rhodanese-like domain-containing protein [Paenibacillus herberti]OXM16081.1 sulfurtransferase [Paenibacillus herberti]